MCCLAEIPSFFADVLKLPRISRRSMIAASCMMNIKSDRDLTTSRHSSFSSSFSWRKSLEKLLKSLGLALVVRDLTNCNLHYEAWAASAVDQHGSEARVTSESESIVLLDGSKIWYPFYNAYGTSEEAACKLWLEAAVGSKLFFFRTDVDADDDENCPSKIVLVPKLDVSDPNVLSMQLDLLRG